MLLPYPIPPALATILDVIIPPNSPPILSPGILALTGANAPLLSIAPIPPIAVAPNIVVSPPSAPETFPPAPIVIL